MRKWILVIILIVCGAYLSVLNGEQEKPKTGGPFEVEPASPSGRLDKPASKYWMYVPEEYTPHRSWPFMVVLHGAGGSAQNFIRAFVNEARKHKYIITAVKSQGQSWSGGDHKLILSTMEYVRKNYNVDPERVFLAGFSAGGFMTCDFGFRNHSLFRGLGPMAAAQGGGGSKVREHLTVLIVCGDKDPNYGVCKQVYESLKKQKFDTELHTMQGVGHTLDPTAIPWLFTEFQERLNQPEDLLRRGKKAMMDKRYLDAIDCFQQIIDEKKGKKFEKAAQQELKKIEKIAARKFKKALTKLKRKKNVKQKEAAIKLLEEIISQFEGMSVGEKAKEKLNEIENETGQ